MGERGRVLVAAIVIVVASAVTYVIVSEEKSSEDFGGASATASASFEGEITDEPPEDPDVIVTFHSGTPDEVIGDFFLNGTNILPNETVHMDWENNRALLEWAPGTSENLRAATVLVLRNAYPVESVQRIR